MTATLPALERLKRYPAWASLPLFDRTGWRRMAFGEFAESIGERAEPRDAQEEIYVGLEHLDPQCLHIRRLGERQRWHRWQAALPYRERIDKAPM